MGVRAFAELTLREPRRHRRWSDGGHCLVSTHRIEAFFFVLPGIDRIRSGWWSNRNGHNALFGVLAWSSAVEMVLEGDIARPGRGACSAS